MQSENWAIELWQSDEVLEITPQAKEILFKILGGPDEKIPQFVEVSGEMVAVKDIARIRKSRNW